MIEIIHKSRIGIHFFFIFLVFLVSPFIPIRIIFFCDYYNNLMAYKRTIWKARKGTNLNRFKKSQETAQSVILENEPTSVTEPGTPFSTTNMNKIEDGIADAHEMIALEEQSRIDGDKETLAAAQAYTDEAQLATQTWLPAVNTVSALAEITGLNNNINYLCRVIKDPDISKNGVYQCIAGWASEPIWTFFSDNADWIDEIEMAEAIEKAIDEHNTNANAHENIQNDIAEEERSRVEAINTEAAARNHAVNEEAQTRAAADSNLQGNIDDTNSNVQNLRYDFNAWIGRGGYLEAYDFGVYIPTQEQLTNQALAQISTISEPSEIWNGTKIVNLANNYLWVLTNTPNTDPPIFEWTNQGTSDLTPFVADRGGYIVGANNNDPPEYVRAQLNGKGKIDIDAIITNIENRLFDKEHPIGDIVVQYPSTKSPLEKGWRGTWVAWNLPRNTTQGDPLYNPNQISGSGADVWNRPVLYGLATSLASTTAYNENATSAIAANQYRVVTFADGDKAIFQSIAQIPLINDSSSPYNGTIGPFDPVKWREAKDFSTASYRPIFVPREDITGHSWTVDLAIGASVTYKGTSYYVVARHGLGGKFLSGHGGNRPPFEAGGVHGDVLRPIKGRNGAVAYGSSISDGALFSSVANSNSFGGSGYGFGYNDLDISRAVPTGSENSPRTLSIIYWRRVN
jgi:hypothetical protein